MASFTSIPTIPEEQQDERPRVLVVSVAGQLCAMPIELVREVIRPKTITPIPGAPSVASGLVNVRGMVVTVLDLAAALRLDGVPLAQTVTDRAHDEPLLRAVVPSSIVLLEHGSRVVGVAVDAVHDVRPLDAVATSAGEEAMDVAGSAGPDSADASPRIARGVASAGDDIVMRLDLGALLARVMLSSEEGP